MWEFGQPTLAIRSIELVNSVKRILPESPYTFKTHSKLPKITPVGTSKPPCSPFHAYHR
ncbi:hypothetical protein ES708_25957 [subsurface metagenome]